MKFHMLMIMNGWMMLVLINGWMMLVLMKCKCQMQCLTLGCYITCAKYKSVMPRTTIDGVRAMPEQIKGVPPKKRKAPLAVLENKDKHPWMTITLLEKKIEDLSDVIYTLEQRIDEEHVYRKEPATRFKRFESFCC